MGQQRVPRQHLTGFQRVPIENPFCYRSIAVGGFLEDGTSLVPPELMWSGYALQPLAGGPKINYNKILIKKRSTMNKYPLYPTADTMLQLVQNIVAV